MFRIVIPDFVVGKEYFCLLPFFKIYRGRETAKEVSPRSVPGVGPDRQGMEY